MSDNLTHRNGVSSDRETFQDNGIRTKRQDVREMSFRVREMARKLYSEWVI